ncbi:hypothetical protein KW783_00540 [Candidatus Parcubacteria bacterium]|nr:hypothetical protein [Candidatus Parcubacteria bacterium]
MSLELIVFVVSFVLITLHLLLKVYENGRGRATGFSLILSKGDRIILKAALNVRNIRIQTGTVILGHARSVFSRVSSVLSFLKHKLDQKSQEMIYTMRGRHVLQREGSVSFFLKNLSDERSGTE